MRSVRGLTRAGLVWACVLGGGLLFSAGPAVAGTGHGFSASFGSAASTPANPSPLLDPSGVAVDQSTGDVYVVDAGHNRVEKFDASGNFLLAFGAGVGGSGINTCTTGCLEGSAGSEEGQFSAPSGIAVDNSGAMPGDVYVLDAGNDRIEKFSPAGVYISQIDGTGAVTGPGPTTPFGRLQSVAVDPTGDLWVYQEDAEIDEFHADGSFTTSFDCPCSSSPGLAVDASNVYADRGSGEPAVITTTGTYIVDIPNPGTATGLASDPAHGDLYIDEGGSVGEYDTSAVTPLSPGTLVQEFGSGTLAGGAGLAVDTASGNVYVASTTSNDIEVYVLGATPPAPTTDTPSNLTGTTATLNGDLNPGGTPTDYYFSYDQGASCTGPGSTTTPLDTPNGPGNPATGSTDIPETAAITGLQPSTQYAVCFAAHNSFGPSLGAAVTFTSTGTPPVVENENTELITETGVLLLANINPENQDTHYYFQYGTDPPLTSGVNTIPALPGEDIGSSLQGQSVSQSIEGVLTPNTVYYYRAVASNGTTGGNGTTDGQVESFTTRPLPPTATTDRPSEITDTTATLSGVLDGMGTDTHYYFNYGTANTYGSRVPTEESEFFGKDAGVISSDTLESIQLAGLAPNTTYHYQVVALNVTCFFCGLSSQTAYGADMEFTTLALPPVAVADVAGGNISPNSATVTGSADLQGAAGSYHFEYGPSTAYGSSTAVGTLSASELGQAVNANIAGLSPNTTYHYRLAVTNDNTTEYSADETFTTYTTAPATATGQATGVGPSTATLGGSLDPQGADTSYWFEYGTNIAYSTSVPAPGADAGSGNAFQSVMQGIAGLAPGVTYHFRLVTNNAGGTSYGADQTFTTATATAAANIPTTTTPKTTQPPAGKTTAKALTKAQKLAKALKACAKKPKKQRAGCEKQAHKQFGPATKAKKKGKK